MTDKHTPGPWTVIEKPNVILVQCGDHLRASISVSYGDTRWNICNYGTKDEALANAALIARAPDLLAENERLRRLLTDALTNDLYEYATPDSRLCDLIAHEAGIELEEEESK